MPIKRLPQNVGLPTRWRYLHGAYYYAVPKEQREQWSGRQLVRLGKTLPDAMEFFAAATRAIEAANLASVEPINARESGSINSLGQHWERLGIYDPACDMSLIYLRGIYSASRAGAAKRKLPFELAPGDLLRLAARAGGKCMLTGIPWDYETKTRSGKRPWIPSLDRIDASRGYHNDNVRFVCWAVNAALQDFGDETLRRIAIGFLKTTA